MSMICEFKNVSKSFGNRVIFKDLNFSLNEKSSLALVGPSGCGKSTVLNILGLLEEATLGEVRLKDEKIPLPKSRHATLLRRNFINYLFQNFALISDKTAFENVMLGMHFLSLSKDQKKKQVNQVFRELGLQAVAHEKIYTLSGGEQQRVALARCLLKPGELILADEPTGSLDQNLAKDVMTQMMSLKDSFGKTLVIVTHDPMVAGLCDKTLSLKDYTCTSTAASI